MTQQQKDTTALDQMAEQALAAHLEAEAQQQREQEEKQQAQWRVDRSAFLHQLEGVLTPEFLKSGLTFHCYRNERNMVSAYFEYLGIYWHLTVSQPRYTAGTLEQSVSWSIYTNEEEPLQYRQNPQATSLSGEELCPTLLRFMGEHRQKGLEKEAKAQADKTQHDENMRQHELRQQEQAAQRKREQEEKATRLQTCITAAQVEHALLFDELEAKRLQAEAEMWHWPTGVTIEVYELEYCRGSYADEENDEKAFDYAGGWTSAAFLDSRGAIRIETMTRYYGSFPCTILLSPLVHKPMWTVHTFSSIEELPSRLQQEIKVSLPHATWDSGYFLDKVTRLKRLEPDEYTEDYTASVTVGKEPLPWIRALVEQQVQKDLSE